METQSQMSSADIAHRLIVGDCEKMHEIEDESVNLIITSPPYFNAPFDYSGVYSDYKHYLSVMTKIAHEMYRVLQYGRILVLNIDDMLVDGVKYPITADLTHIMTSVGFRYRDKITWKKPDGYLRISKRSGVLLQNPYPMYFYPDNLLESLLIFQKDKFDYSSITKDIKEVSRIDTDSFKSEKWYSSLWEITNVLPNAKLEKGIAAFPEEIPKRFIILFSYKGETILDPFVGSGTTMKAAKDLGRKSIGIEINPDLEGIVRQKCGFIGSNEFDLHVIRRGEDNYVRNNSNNNRN